MEISQAFRNNTLGQKLHGHMSVWGLHNGLSLIKNDGENLMNFQSVLNLQWVNEWMKVQSYEEGTNSCLLSCSATTTTTTTKLTKLTKVQPGIKQVCDWFRPCPLSPNRLRDSVWLQPSCSSCSCIRYVLLSSPCLWPSSSSSPPWTAHFLSNQTYRNC